MPVLPEPVPPLEPELPLFVCTTAVCVSELEPEVSEGPGPPPLSPPERSARSSSGSRESRTLLGRTCLVRLEPDRHKADQKLDNMTRLLNEKRMDK
jgi:hypothetical protein